jgi:hypothetical protein
MARSSSLDIPSDASSPAPPPSRRTRHISSDKENATPSATATKKSATRNPPPSTQRLKEMDPSQALHHQLLEKEGNRDVYDPDQPAAERREVRKGYRNLQRTLDGTNTSPIEQHASKHEIRRARLMTSNLRIQIRIPPPR